MRKARQLRLRGEHLRGPIIVSLSCHGALLSASVVWGVLNPTISLGSRDASGSSGVVAVASVPINVMRTDANPVANPTSHSVPAPTEFRSATEVEQPEPAPSEEPAAPVPEQARRQSDQQRERSVGQRSAGEPDRNELRSSRGAALSSTLYQAAPGSTFGFGGQKGGPFGNRFAWYAEILQRAIGEQWRRTLGQVSGGASKPVVATFVIRASGQIDQVAVRQASGNRSLDYSALRAINNASPVRPLPRGIGKRSVVIEMHFRLD